MDERIKKLADNLIHYSLDVKPGDKVYIHYIGNATKELARALIKETYNAGGLPFPHFTDPQVQREVILNCSEEQLKLMAEIDGAEMRAMDCYLGIRGTDNVSELADVPDDRMTLYETLYANEVHGKIRVPMTRWAILRYPNAAMAQLNNTSQEAFEDFFFDVCTMDYSRMGKAMKNLVDLMNRTDRVRLAGPGTDLAFSIKDIPAIPCDGKINIPDGEVFTAPVRDSVNGTITYNTPSLYQGYTYENVSLTFE
ncbi:MAG: aminopeptidase, partial [Lachnospiraceae bacterium]|nr:aminopeptidase [Lachnospiraceae bacterium]